MLRTAGSLILLMMKFTLDYPGSWFLGLSSEENAIDFPKETVEAPLPQPVVSLLTDLWQALP